jgi:hypothetical protein
MSKRISSFITGLALLTASAGIAEAGGAKVIVGGAPWPGQARHGGFHSRPKVVDTAPNKVIIPHRSHFVHPGHGHPHPGHGHRHPGHVHRHPGYAYSPIYVAPTYIAPSYGQWVPGYWSYVWVPQASNTGGWVPGYYDRDGVWVAGYHSAQAVQGGYYQPYWVSGYWSP